MKSTRSTTNQQPYVSNMPVRLFEIILCGLALPTIAYAQHEKLSVSGVNGFLSEHCHHCHDEDSASGGMDFASLGNDLSDAEVTRLWTRVHDRVAAGEMPPGDETPPDAVAKRAFLKTLAGQLTRADQARKEVVLRRLNRLEFENTMRDLFGLPDLDIRSRLPEDATAHGFDTVGEVLSLSKEQMMALLATVDFVLDQALESEPVPEPTLRVQQRFRSGWKQARQLPDNQGIVLFDSRPNAPTELNFGRTHPTGRYRFRLHLRTVDSTRPIITQIYAGGFLKLRSRGRRLISFHEVPTGDDWTVIEFEQFLKDYETIKVLPWGLAQKPKDPDSAKAPGLWLGKAEIEGPFAQPGSGVGRKIFVGDLDPETATETDATLVLNRLLPVIFRRPARAGEVEPFAEVTRQALQNGRPWLEAVRLGAKTMFVSPGFLYFDDIATADGVVSDFALASRMSYMLWKSLPDETLLGVAASGRLRDRKILHREVERMLADPRARRFIDNFTDQWLRLNRITATTPDEYLYPEFNELLQFSMIQETRLFFTEVLRRDLPVRDFLAADWTILNSLLADHYGIGDVKGVEFRRVALPGDGVRGGLLSQAAILKTTANGTVTSPVLRGNFVLENILGQPVPPPPSNVPAIEPDTSGATTLRQTLEAHRELESCAGCHRRIDPPGFALEVFNPIGGERKWYRSTKGGNLPEPTFIDRPWNNRHVRYRRGQDVDASGVTPDGREFTNYREYRQLLASRPEVLAHTLVEKLLIYGLGRSLGFSDREPVARIVEKSASAGYGLRTLIHEVIQSELFHQP